MQAECPRKSIGDIARQVLEEWEGFSWEQKQRLIEYVKLQEGGDQQTEEKEADGVGSENCEGEEDEEDGGIVKCSQDEEDQINPELQK